MGAREPEAESFDPMLRSCLDPDRETVERVRVAALTSNGAPAAALAAPMRLVLAALVLAAGLLLLLGLPRGQKTPAATPRESIRIANYGQLVTVADPSGAIWLHAPTGRTDDSSPRLIITLGGLDAN